MKKNDMYLMKNFDFLAQSFARMNAQGQPSIFRPLLVIWMKRIANGFVNAMNFTAARRIKP